MGGTTVSNMWNFRFTFFFDSDEFAFSLDP